MSRGDERKHAARTCQSAFREWSTVSKRLPQRALPHLGGCIGVVKQPSPETIGVGELLPILLRFERLVQVRATASCMPAAFAPFKREGLADLQACGPAEVGCAAVRSRHRRISP